MNEGAKRIAIGVAALFVSSGLLGTIYWSVSGPLEDNLVYYWSPSELEAKGDAALGSTVRLAGQVVPGSVDWQPAVPQLVFRLTDTSTEMAVSSSGAPPQMFREGVGVVVEGKLAKDGVFYTERVMVKHSNEYRVPGDGEDHVSDLYKTLASEDGT